MAAAVEPISMEKGRPYDPPQRTKAMPKHTLFGSEVQHLSEKEKKEVKELDLEKVKEKQDRERQARQQRYKKNLPPYLKKNISDENAVEAEKEIQKQLKTTSKAKKDYDLLETKSKYFQVGVVGNPTVQSNNSNNDSWHNADALKNSAQMNNGGVKPGKASFNRDKYEKEKPSHQYSGIGNPIKLGMDFDDNASSGSQAPPPEYKRHRAPDWQPASAFIPKPKADDLGLPVDVPANIRHKFGTNVVKEVLNNKTRVEQTIELQARIRAANNKSRNSGTSLDLPSANTEYEALSHSVRQNIFPGHAVGYTTSTKHDFAGDVFDRRVPDTDEFRCQRHALTIWTEQKFIADQLAERWKDYDDSRPKLQANWDRNAKRPPPHPGPRTEPKKAKPKPLKKAKNEAPQADDDFPVIEFKTPPLTPLPPPPEKAPMPEYVKDDDFWEFFDQPIPK